MKKQFLLFGLIVVLFSACHKETFNTPKQTVIDNDKIKAYIAANHINATLAPSGIYYEILITGNGSFPNDTSHVQVSYSGKLLNGTIFQPQSTDIIPLTSTVVGWQDGVPLISQGGRIRLIVPSSLGYGSGVSGTVPANSVLDFTIDLLGFF